MEIEESELSLIRIHGVDSMNNKKLMHQNGKFIQQNIDSNFGGIRFSNYFTSSNTEIRKEKKKIKKKKDKKGKKERMQKKRKILIYFSETLS